MVPAGVIAAVFLLDLVNAFLAPVVHLIIILPWVMLFLGDVPSPIAVIPVRRLDGRLQAVDIQAILVYFEIAVVSVGPDNKFPVILGRGIRAVLLPEPDQIVGFLRLLRQGHGRVKIVMRVIVVCRVVALRPVIGRRHDDLFRLLDIKAPVFPVVDLFIPSHGRLLHDDIHAIGQVAGDVIVPLIQPLIHRKGRVILIRAASLGAVPFHAVDGVQVVVVERP